MIANNYEGQSLKDTFNSVRRFLIYRMPLTPVDDLHIWKTFLKHAALSSKDGLKAIQWGNPPYLQVANLPKNVYGKFTPEHPDTIFIAKCVASKFESDYGGGSKGQKAIYYLRAILLHEMVHWGDWRDDHVQSDAGRPHDDDAGRRFEEEAYYKKVYPKEWIGDY